MEQTNLLKELIHQIKDNKLLSDCGNAARTTGINGGENNKAGANDEVTRPVPLEGTTKEDVMKMVEATAMVYKVMEEQHNVESLVPKEPAILKDEMRLNEFALQLCHTHGIPEHDTNGCPANIFEMNTSIATLSVQCGDENSLYLEGNRVKPRPSASLVMWTTRTIWNIVMCGLCTSMSRTPSPTSGSMWAICLAITSHVVIT
jgi:hypothetical protein